MIVQQLLSLSKEYCSLNMPLEMNEDDLQFFKEWLALIIRGAERRTKERAAQLEAEAKK